MNSKVETLPKQTQEAPEQLSRAYLLGKLSNLYSFILFSRRRERFIRWSKNDG